MECCSTTGSGSWCSLRSVRGESDVTRRVKFGLHRAVIQFLAGTRIEGTLEAGPTGCMSTS